MYRTFYAKDIFGYDFQSGNKIDEHRKTQKDGGRLVYVLFCCCGGRRRGLRW